MSKLRIIKAIFYDKNQVFELNKIFYSENC